MASDKRSRSNGTGLVRARKGGLKRMTDAKSPARIDRLIAGYRRGLDTPEAAALAGVTMETVYRWRQQGRGGDADEWFVELEARIREAQAEYTDETLESISSSRAARSEPCRPPAI